MSETFDRLKSAVLADLRNARQANALGRTQLSIYNYNGQEGRPNYARTPGEAVELYAVFYSLVADGIIVPGGRGYLPDLSNFNSHFKDFPYFTVTEFGINALDPANADIDPHDRSKYVAEVRRRMPTASDVLKAYVGEATATYEHQHYLAATVLLGVAAEELLEQLYRNFADHLKPTGKANFNAKLDKERWATARFKVFSDHFTSDRTELSADLRQRVDDYLEVLITLT